MAKKDRNWFGSSNHYSPYRGLQHVRAYRDCPPDEPPSAQGILAATAFFGMFLLLAGFVWASFPEQPTRKQIIDKQLGLAVLPEYHGCKVKRPSHFNSKVISCAAGEDRDHRVPWNEALQSGLCTQPEARRRAFYNDNSNLWCLDEKVNRDIKRDKDYAGWSPSDHLVRCDYARKYLATKKKYRLSVDREEAFRLKNSLAGCR